MSGGRLFQRLRGDLLCVIVSDVFNMLAEGCVGGVGVQW